MPHACTVPGETVQPIQPGSQFRAACQGQRCGKGWLITVSACAERSRVLPACPACPPGFLPEGAFGEALFFAKPSLDGGLLELRLSLDRRASRSATRAVKRRTSAINGNNRRISASFCAWLRLDRFGG